jgi:hypothetical protein
MKDIRVNDFVAEGTDEMVIVTGIPRSGTSIVGKVLGSLYDVEYAFEPPLVPFLDARVRWGAIEPQDAIDIFETYLYYEYFLEYLHGRRYNFRPSDDSFILSMKPFPEIVEKWEAIGSTQDAIGEAQNRTFIFKSPGVYDILNHFYEYSPKIRVVHILRDLERVIASMMRKRWFHDENLGPNSTGLWPFLNTEGERMVPYLVAEDTIEAWQSMNAETRTVHVCNQLASNQKTFRQRYSGRRTYYELDFGAFVQSPGEVVADLSSFLGLDPGPKTEAIVGEVMPTDPPYDVERILERCDPDEVERFSDLADSSPI